MKIVLGSGVGDLRFGSTKTQVEEILGLGDKFYITDSGCRRVQFNETMLELSFEPENENLLGWVEVHNSQATLFGHKLIGQPRQIVLDILAKELGQPSEYEDYGSFETAFYMVTTLKHPSSL